MMIRVLIADDQSMIRAGFRSLLAAEPDIDVVGESPDGEAACAAVAALDPDVVLMDIRMPVLDGIAATRRITSGAGRARILVLTTYDLDEYVYDALRAGASGFLLKDAMAEDLIHAVRSVAAGDALLDPAVTRRVIEAYVDRLPANEPCRSIPGLTTREIEVLEVMARGMSNAEIAAELFISRATAKTHVSNVITKLGLRDRVHCVIYAYEAGLVRPGSS